MVNGYEFRSNVEHNSAFRVKKEEIYSGNVTFVNWNR